MSQLKMSNGAASRSSLRKAFNQKGAFLMQQLDEVAVGGKGDSEIGN